ncbi:unnamed protein product [Ectocarpus fasciculatus]
MPDSKRPPPTPASSPPATPPPTRHRPGQSPSAPDPALSAQQPPASTVPPPPILANATVVLSSDKLEDLPCFDRASIGAASSVNANRVWLPDQEVYLGVLPLAEATAQLAPLATTIPPLLNAETLARGEFIEHGTEWDDVSPEFRSHLGKRVLAECVVRLAHSAGLLKKGELCVILPTAGELEAFEPGSGGTSGGAQEEEEEDRQAPYQGQGFDAMRRRLSSMTLDQPEAVAGRTGGVDGGAAQAVAVPARNSEHEDIVTLPTQPSNGEAQLGMASTDRKALIALFEATRGAKWRISDNWGTSEALGTWYGVDVDAGGRVNKLSLYNNNLEGPLPPQLGDLGALQHLALDANWLSGHIPDALGGLSNLKVLSLHNNGLEGPIPKRLGALTKLEKLLLFNNKLSGSIPDELGNLSELLLLHLGVNHLGGVIPKKLGALSHLQMLHLGNNQLDGPIPEALGALGELKELGLSNNKLSESIPKQLGDMAKLERVWINTNKLSGSLPPQLAAPRALRLLHLQENQLTDIPRETAELFNAKPWFTDIKLGVNRWKNPQWQVIQGGWNQVISFYEGLAQSGGVVAVPSLKVVLVGAVHAGKTTLTRGLLDEKLLEVPPPRTRGVDVHVSPWTPKFDPPVEVVIWDFAGHDDYYSTHQLFLTSGALHLLVVDLHKFACDPSSTGDTVYVWLDSLLCRVPGSVVLVVATHADAFGDDHEGSAAALNELEAAIEEHLEEKRKEWQTAQRQAERAKQTSQDRFAPPASDSSTGYPTGHAAASPPKLQLCGFISASGRSLGDLSVLGRKIWQIASDVSLFPDIKKLPKSWRRVWAVMDALREGADPEKAVRLDGPLAPVQGRDKHDFVTREAALEAWWRADGESVAELKAKDPDSQTLNQDSSRLFQAALKQRQMGGLVLEACGLVHLNVAWINELLRELLDHRLADPKQASYANWWVGKLKTHCHDRGVKFNRLIGIHRRFVITGILTKEYLRFLWRDVKAVRDEEVFGRLVNTMALHDAMFPCEKNGGHEGEGEFVVPARLPASVACASLAELEKAVSQGTRMQFVIAIHAGYVPPGIIPQFLGELKRRDGGVSGNFVFHVSWNRGVGFMTAGQEILVRLGETCSPSQRFVEVNIAGDT